MHLYMNKYVHILVWPLKECIQNICKILHFNCVHEVAAQKEISSREFERNLTSETMNAHIISNSSFNKLLK